MSKFPKFSIFILLLFHCYILTISTDPTTPTPEKSATFSNSSTLPPKNYRFTLIHNGTKPKNSTRRKFELSPEPTPAPTVREDWGGNCTDADWTKCSRLKTYFSYYVDKNDPEKKLKHHEIDCKIQPIICLTNGWTVTRCQLLCMGKCNKALLSKYDDYVVKDGQC